MEVTAFYRELETTLEIPANTIVTGGEELDSICIWNSMALLSIIAMADELFQLEIDPTQLKKCKTPLDLVSLCKGEIAI